MALLKRSSTWVPILTLAILLGAQQSGLTAERDSTALAARHPNLDARLAAVLAAAGFTGNVEATLETRLGRPVDRQRADLGRRIFFDNINGLHNDNSCAGCHTPAFGFGDSQSIAIGVQNNGIVGSHRRGPRNQRKAPVVINSAFFPKLMLNGRFFAPTADPFDNSMGFHFPPPEGVTRFPPKDPDFPTLLSTQGHIPSTELVEMAGFGGTRGQIGPDFDQFDDAAGDTVPQDADGDGFRNEEIRTAVLARYNTVAEYRERFGAVFNYGVALPEGGIDFAMVGKALAEFQTSLTFANAPIDRFARGERSALTTRQKRGALLFFGKAMCVQCHAVAGTSNEMFSDFENHVIGVPQIAPFFGVGRGNVKFDGPKGNEDFGAEQISGDSRDRYAFRTSPLRNVAVQAAFMHNGAFARLEDAILHHLSPYLSALSYDPVRAGVAEDLTHRRGPTLALLSRLDPVLRYPIVLTRSEFLELVAFVRQGLLDPRARPENLCQMVPPSVPSGRPTARFEGCPP